MNTKKPAVNHVGTSLILVVLIILALVTFAVLSLVQTNRDRLYSDQIRSVSTAYHEACHTAENILADIDTVLLQNWSENTEEWYDDVATVLAENEDLSLDFSSDPPLVRYQVAFGDERALDVVLEITPPSDTDDPFYRIIRWEEISTHSWQGDNSLNLMQ